MTLEETPFIDADGSQQTVPARVFDGTDEALVLTDGWYVFKGTHEFQEKIRIKGNISMILEDGCLFKGCVPDSGLTLIESRSVAVLSLYGQSGQTGTLDIASNRFTVTDLRLYGGVVRSERSFGGKLSTYIKGGTVSAQSLTNPKFGTVISGGNVTTTGKSILVNDYEFGWSSITDSISLGGFMPQGSKGSIIITDGQAFADEDGDIYVDSLPYDQIMALEGKTLTPYFNYHQYGESEWVWSEHNDEATAVFTCTKEGCGDVRRVEAKVDFNVDGDNGVYTAECTFFGQKYTTEKRVTLRHGITINVNGGGTVTAGQEKPKAGDDVELTVTPDSGYTLWSLSVTDGSGSVTGPDTAQFNDPVTITITADEGCALYNLYADDAWGETADIYENNTFYMLDNNVTVHAEFVPIIPAKAPYIDENGEYHLGNIEHCNIGGMYFSVKDGVIDKELDSVDVSYFDFKDNGSSYQVNYYTDPTENLTELVIPKSYNGKPVTVVGSNNDDVFIVGNGTKPQFKLTLNENIEEIKHYTFYTMWVKEVGGDTSALNKIGNFAFSWANSTGGYSLDLRLDYPGEITVGYETFNNMNVTAHMKHSAHFGNNGLHLNSLTYDFTDEHTYGNPYWSWAYDYSSAEATFACTDKRCHHSESVDAAVQSETENGIITSHATAEFRSNTYTDSITAYADGIGARLAGHSILLSGDIGVNFYMELSNDTAYSETAYMHFTIPTGDTVTESDVYVKDARKESSGGKEYYVFKCCVAAKEMTSEIKAQIIDGDRSGEEYTYSVKEYADYLLAHTGENDEWDKAVPLVRAMLNYGAYSQAYFDKNPDKPANAGLTDEQKALGEISIDVADPVVKDLPEGTTFEGSTLSLKSVTTLSLYFKSSETLKFDCGGYTVETVQSGGYQVARIRGIEARFIGEAVTLKAGDSGSVTYSPLNYCKNVLTLSTSTEDEAKNEQTQKLQNAVKAPYLYWQAACDYFN